MVHNRLVYNNYPGEDKASSSPAILFEWGGGQGAMAKAACLESRRMLSQLQLRILMGPANTLRGSMMMVRRLHATEGVNIL